MAKDDEKVEAQADQEAEAVDVAETAEEYPLFQLPDKEFHEFGNDWHPYQLRLRFKFKQMTEKGKLRNKHFEPGDYVGVGNDGGVLHLTEEELNENYEPIGPGGASS